MDSLTHIAIGACMGEAFAGKKLGRKAMLWGALAQSIPDIDFVAAIWMDTPGSLLAHRGFTHSFLFAAFMTLLMALMAERWHRPHNISFRRWLLFFGGAILGHLLLDVFNNYGVGWLEPFSQQRFSLNAMYVADPFFSIGPGIAGLVLLLLPKKHRKRSFWWKFGLISASIYLLLALVGKWKIDADIRQIFARQQVPHNRYFSTPAPLQNMLWYVVAGNNQGYYVGYRSLLDAQDSMSFQFFPRNDSLLSAVNDQETLQRLKRFSQDFYTVEKWSDTLVFNDLRFGQMIGWQNPREKFAFHYFVNYPEENRLVVQRGRFAKWDWEVAQGLLHRVAGQ